MSEELHNYCQEEARTKKPTPLNTLMALCVKVSIRTTHASFFSFWDKTLMSSDQKETKRWTVNNDVGHKKLAGKRSHMLAAELRAKRPRSDGNKPMDRLRAACRRTVYFCFNELNVLSSSFIWCSDSDSSLSFSASRWPADRFTSSCYHESTAQHTLTGISRIRRSAQSLSPTTE